MNVYVTNVAHWLRRKVEVGFTGTRKGMTDRQMVEFNRLLGVLDISSFHHGDCVGADEEAHSMVDSREGIRIVIHPPWSTKFRAYCQRMSRHPPVMCDPQGYLTRNKAIVDAVDILIAVPGGPEKLRSGTWSTIRYAIRRRERELTLRPRPFQFWILER